MVYKWSINLYSKVDANAAGAELEKIERENGEITSKAVVEVAKSEQNVLHKLFDWDNKIAGEKWRLTQARSIIAALVVVPEKKGGYDKRAFVNIVNDPENPSHPPRFINYETAMNDEETRNILLANAMRELHVFKEKYKKLKELAKVIEAINSIEGGGIC